VEVVNAIIAGIGVGVTALVAWVSTRTTRARRRAEEAQLALNLLKAARGLGDESLAGDAQIATRLTDTARFATVEFTRLMLADGPRWWSILPVLSYGMLLLVAAAFTTSVNGATVFVWIAIVCFAYSGIAIWIKRRRSHRLTAAGIYVASVKELIEEERRDWARVLETRRAARRETGVARDARKKPDRSQAADVRAKVPPKD
jgi:hypothetical protein